MDKPKLLSLEFEHDCWSWGLIAPKILSHLADTFDITCIEYSDWRGKGAQIDENMIILSQNATQVRSIDEKNIGRTIMRLGGNRTFDAKAADVTDFYKKQLSKCFGVIATNKKLAEIAMEVNSNVQMIPNALDVEEWKPLPHRAWNFKKPLVGFVGNISSSKKRMYKGYPFLREACKLLKLPLREALYKNKQIPHNKMKDLFYHQIDVLVLPTFGEGCSNTIMEALACGVPVITTRTAGYHGDNLIDGENVLFCERTTKSIVEQLKRLIWQGDVFKHLSKNGRKFAIAHHDVSVVAEQYREIFVECLKANS